jgi:CBS-domain-containing membrane protein
MHFQHQGKALVLSIYIGEADQWHGNTLYVEIVEFLRKHGCAGATVTRAIAGYGAGGRLHRENILYLSSDAPVMIQVVDHPARIHRLLPQISEMVTSGLITLHEAEVLKYTHAHPHRLARDVQVQHIMEPVVTTVSPNTALTDIIPLLLDAPFRALPVIDEQQHLVGIISSGDLIDAGILPTRRGIINTARTLDEQTAQAVEQSLLPIQQQQLQAKDVMNSMVRTVTPETLIGEAAQIMLTTGLRRLPVVNTEDVLQGIVSRTDLLQVAVTSPLSHPAESVSTTTQVPAPPTAQLAPQQPVSHYMHTNATTVDEQTPLTDVIDALLVSPWKRVIVVDGEYHVQGIISDIDVLARIQDEKRPNVLRALMQWARGETVHFPIGTLHGLEGKPHTATDVMNHDVLTIMETASVQETIEMMMASGRKLLPVVDQERRLAGIVGRSDLLRMLAEGA